MVNILDAPVPDRFTLVLRWILAPLVGAASSLVLFAILFAVARAMLGMEELRAMSSTRAGVATALLFAAGAISWALTASSVVPKRHRRVALIVFSSPVVLFALLLGLVCAISNVNLMVRSVTAGLWLASACIAAIAFPAQSPSWPAPGPGSSGDRSDFAERPRPSPRQIVTKAGAILLFIAASVLILIAFAVVAIALYSARTLEYASLALTVLSFCLMSAHLLLIGWEQLSYRSSRKRWVELPAEIVHRMGSRTFRYRKYVLLEGLGAVVGFVLVLAARNLPTEGIATLVLLALLSVALLIYYRRDALMKYIRAISVRPMLAMDRRGLRIGMPPYDAATIIPWRHIRKVSGLMLIIRLRTIYFLLLDVDEPERFGLKRIDRLSKRFFRIGENVSLFLFGFLEHSDYIIDDIQAFHARYSAEANERLSRF